MVSGRGRILLAVGVLGASLLVSSAADPPVALADAPPLLGACPMPSGSAPSDDIATMRAGSCFVDYTLDPYTDTYVHVADASMSPSTISYGEGEDQTVSVSFSPDHVWEVEDLQGNVEQFVPRGRLGSPTWPCENGCGPGTLALVRTRWPGEPWGSWGLRTQPPFTLRSPWLSCEITAGTCSYTLDWLVGTQGEAIPDMQILMPMPWHPMDEDGNVLFVARTIYFPISVVGGPGTGRPPDASFEINPVGSSGTQWQFLSTSTDPDGPDQIVSWDWDFGGNVFAFGESVVRSFPAGTVRDVTLTVTDVTGRSDSVTRRFGAGDLDISQVVVDPDPLEPGEDATMTVRVRNPGTGDVTGVAPTLGGITPAGGLTVVSGPSPASATVAAGTTVDFTYAVQAGAVDEVSLQVGAAGTARGSAVSADPVTRVIDVVSSGLGVTLSASASDPEVGDDVTITATVTNTGDGTIEDVGPGTLTIDPAVSAPGTVSGPSPSGTVDLAAGTSATFTWEVTFGRGGPHQLAVDVIGTDPAGDPVTGSGSTTVDVVTDAQLDVGVVFVPEDPPPAAGDPFPVDVIVSNVGNVPIDDLSLDLSTLAVPGGATLARVGAAPALSGSIAPGADRTVRASYRATKAGPATWRAVVTGVGPTGDPVTATVDRSVDVTGPALTYGSPGEDGVVRDMAVGSEHALTGRGWDPDGGPIEVTWGDDVVATIPADERFERPLRLPPFPDAVGDDRCAPAALVGRQGDLSASLPIAGVPMERILASEEVDLTAAGEEQSVTTGVRCKGELFTSHAAPDALLVTEALLPDGGRETAVPGGGAPTLTGYEGLWIQAADIDVLGLLGREVVIEMPRSGSGPLTRHTFASTTWVSPAVLDPRSGDAPHTALREPYYGATVLDHTYVADRSVTFGGPVRCEGLLFATQWVWFTQGLDMTGEYSCLMGVNQTLRVNGRIVGDALDPDPGSEEPGVRSAAVAARRVELLRAGSHMTTVGAAAAPGDTEVDVEAGGDLSIGDDVWIGPETGHGETGEIVGFGSIILATPLRSAHAEGEQILNLAGLSTAGLPGPTASPGGPARPPSAPPAAPAPGSTSGALARTGSDPPTSVGLLLITAGVIVLLLARRSRLRSTSLPS